MDIEELYSFIDSPEKLIKTRLALISSFEMYFKFIFRAVNESPPFFEPFHKKVINKLEEYVFQENEKTNLFINIPVGSGKSLLVEYFISWCFARHINHTFLYISHSAPLIGKLSKETKEIIENPIWLQIFQSSLKVDQRSKINWSFDGSKTRTGLFAGTMGGAITGLDAGNPNVDGFSGSLIIDDPIDIGNLRYELQRKECQIYMTDKLETRKRTPQTPTIAIAQRGHQDDLAGFLKDNYFHDWEFLIIPALNDDQKSYWEKKEPAKNLIKMKDINPFKFYSQYQQVPINAGGTVIKSEWFQYYESLNKLKFRRLFMTADTAQKTKEHNDFSVFCAWGIDVANLYLIDLIRGKWEAPELLEAAKKFWNKWKFGLNGKLFTKMIIEDKVSGTGLIQTLKRSARMPIQAKQRNTDKLIRVEDILDTLACQKVYLPFNKSYKFNPVLISECEGFQRDMSHAHDDIIDNICDAVNEFSRGFSREDLL